MGNTDRYLLLSVSHTDTNSHSNTNSHFHIHIHSNTYAVFLALYHQRAHVNTNIDNYATAHATG